MGPKFTLFKIKIDNLFEFYLKTTINHYIYVTGNDKDINIYKDIHVCISATVRLHVGVTGYTLPPALCLSDVWIPLRGLGS